MPLKKNTVRMGVVAVATLMLAACGGGKIGQNGSSSQAAPNNKKITLITGVKAEPFYTSMRCGAEDEAKKLGYELNTQEPDKFEASLQTPIVTGVLSARPAGMMIAPTDAKALNTPMKQVRDAGIKLVEVDTSLEDKSVALSSISSNNEQGGKLAAETLAKLVGNSTGSVLVLNTKAGTSTTDARAKGFEVEINKYPNLRYIGQEYTENEPLIANQKVSGKLTAYPDLIGIFATNLNSGEGASTALRNAQKQGKVNLVGFDASPKQIEDLRNGTVQALIAQDPYNIGKQGVQQVSAALEGRPVTRDIATDLVSLTKADMETRSQYFYKQKC